MEDRLTTKFKNGFLYRINSKKASFGIWISTRKNFLVHRNKFGCDYLFEEPYSDCLPAKELYNTQFSDKDVLIIPKQRKDNYEYFDYVNSDNILKYLINNENKHKEVMTN